MRKSLYIFMYMLLAIVVLFGFYVLRISEYKRAYTDDVNVQIKNFIQQQNFSLQRLNNHILPALRSNDVAALSTYLAAYEDVLFGVAKQGHSPAVTVQFVNLNAPELIVSSKGIESNSTLAPDHEYYSKIIEDPYTLIFSHYYVKAEMPDYPLLDFGIGVTDSLNNYYGQIDVKVAVLALQNFITSKITQHKDLFSFELQNNNSLQPRVYIQQAACWQGCFNYVGLRFLVLVFGVAAYYLAIRHTRQIRQQRKDLSNTALQLQEADQQLKLMQNANSVQHKYGVLAHLGNTKQNINLAEFTQDVIAVNAPLALQSGIKIIVANVGNNNLLVRGNKLRLMQIVSGMLHEIILQLPAKSSVQLKVTITKQIQGTQLVEFCFTDDGFYEALIPRFVEQSNSDVRCYSWDSIEDLIEQEDAFFEHQHQMYQGNVLKFAIETEILNNVVNFEEYLQLQEILEPIE